MGSAPDQAKADQAKSVTQRLLEEVFNHGRLDLIDELVAEDAVEHEALPISTGEMRADLRAWISELRRAFPDYHVDVEELIGEGDKVVVLERVTGTNSGPLFGIPPTGRTFCIDAIDIVRIDEGRVVEHWGLSDGTTMVRQLGFAGGDPMGHQEPDGSEA